jgi:phosphatidylglycerophosphate synthase
MAMAPAAHGLLRRAVYSILAAALLLGVFAQVAANLLGLDAAYLPKVLTVFAAGAALVLIGLGKHHPFASFGSANQVTVARGALIALLAGLIGERAGPGVAALATWVAGTAAVLDAVDGWLARRTGMASPFGARFDMETDALLIMVLAVLAWQFGKAGVWVLASGLLRYVFVAAGTVVPLLRGHLPPSQRRKIVAVVQVVALNFVIAPFVPAPLSACIAAIGLAALTLSFSMDVVWLLQHAPQSRAPVSPQ